MFPTGWNQGNDLDTGLYILDDLLLIATGKDELDIGGIFIDIITEDLLALLVDQVHVINDDHLFTAMVGPGLAKGFHIIAEIRDSLLLLQIVDEKDLVFLELVMAS